MFCDVTEDTPPTTRTMLNNPNTSARESDQDHAFWIMKQTTDHHPPRVRDKRRHSIRCGLQYNLLRKVFEETSVKFNRLLMFFGDLCNNFILVSCPAWWGALAMSMLLNAILAVPNAWKNHQHSCVKVSWCRSKWACICTDLCVLRAVGCTCLRLLK